VDPDKPYRDELTPVTFIERAGTVHACRVAVIDGLTTYTWAQFRARSRRLASALRVAGLRHGDTVAFLALNSEPLLLAHFAVLQAGGVLVAINTRLTAEEVAYIVDHSGSRWIFFSRELEHCVAQVSEATKKIEIGPELEAFIASGSDALLESWLENEEEPCAIDYTSGTTGRPKGVVYHHRGAFLNALSMVAENRLTADSCHLWTLPMFHCNGWSHTWAMAAAGCKSVCIPRIDPGQVWRLLDQESVTHFNGAPTVLIMLAADPAAHRLKRPVRVCTGGAPPSPTLIQQMSSFNIDLVHLYGLTETYGPLSINVPRTDFQSLPAVKQFEYRARQGFAHVGGAKIRVVDEHMRDVPADGATLGEVVIRGNTLMRGYHRDPQATEESFRGGWFHSGDLGVMHEDGSIELRDRKKDIIISGGENISTIEVEQAIASHSAVMEVAVIAAPDEKWGEVPHAFVALKPGMVATEQEIVDHVRGRLVHFKAPKSVTFGDLPKTSTGKIQKFVLREKVWAGHTKRIH
jgi:acyl-CoA synthetase (AMP-forming)/AMP-acid ligase II